VKEKTPLVDELEKVPWPSFVKEIKRAAKKHPSAQGLLKQVELLHKDKITHWKHGGIVGVTAVAAELSNGTLMSLRGFPRLQRSIPTA
jgi:hypothetical protein